VIRALFQRSEGSDALRARARKRVQRMPEDMILDWADQCGNGIVKALSDYRRERSPESLLEASQGISSMAGVVDALRARMDV